MENLKKENLSAESASSAHCLFGRRPCLVKKAARCRFFAYPAALLLLLFSGVAFSAADSGASPGTAPAKDAPGQPAAAKNYEIFTEKALGGNSRFYIPQSANELVSAFGSDTWEALNYERHDLVKALQRKPPDFIFCNSDLASVLERYANYTHLLSFKNQVSSDAGKLSGSLFVIPKESRVAHLEELNGKTFGRLATSSMAGWKTALGAVSSLGYDARDFFRRLHSFQDNESMILALTDGKIDAAILQGCHFERLPETLRERIRPLEPRNYPQSACLSTSELYPAWSLLAAPSVPPALRNKVSEALRKSSLFPSFGEWVSPVSLRDVYELLLRTDDDLIHEFRPESWTDLFWKARYPALILVLILLLLLVHDRLVVREVEKQTALVRQSMREKREAERRIEAWERASVVSTMSSMVAHELKQPLAVIENYTQSLISRANSGANSVSPETLSLILSKIDRSAQKAIGIIEHVQGYSKNLPIERRPTNLSELLGRLITEFRGNYPSVGIKEKIEKGVVIEADEFELSICILNVLKNAAQAMKDRKDAAVTVRLTRPEDKSGSVELVISDNGPGLTEDEISRLQNPLQTSKRAGLGLGLSIVRSIAERHRGSVRIQRIEPHGLAITLRLGKEVKEEKKESSL